MDFLTFVAERYNYWVFIVLMMMGLYIVIARGNLIKKMIGLSVFQTSVFIYYISIGKIAGGTAPVYLYDDLKKRMAHGEHHAAEKLAGKPPIGQGSIHADPSLPDGFRQPGNDLESLTEKIPSPSSGETLHSAHGAANDILAAPDLKIDNSIADAAMLAKELGKGAAEVIYTNPLPHVLILTAIVVGVATTAVGLSLIVRIREAYGTIEEDELEAADHVAEFGDGAHKRAASA
jgi:multicomponent Na+:H+ antiporter subunit C